MSRTSASSAQEVGQLLANLLHLAPPIAHFGGRSGFDTEGPPEQFPFGERLCGRFPRGLLTLTGMREFLVTMRLVGDQPSLFGDPLLFAAHAVDHLVGVLDREFITFREPGDRGQGRGGDGRDLSRVDHPRLPSARTACQVVSRVARDALTVSSVGRSPVMPCSVASCVASWPSCSSICARCEQRIVTRTFAASAIRRSWAAIVARLGSASRSSSSSEPDQRPSCFREVRRASKPLAALRSASRLRCSSGPSSWMDLTTLRNSRTSHAVPNDPQSRVRGPKTLRRFRLVVGGLFEVGRELGELAPSFVRRPLSRAVSRSDSTLSKVKSGRSRRRRDSASVRL